MASKVLRKHFHKQSCSSSIMKLHSFVHKKILWTEKLINKINIWCRAIRNNRDVMSECNTTSCSFFFNSEYILLDSNLSSRLWKKKTLIQSYPRKIFENCRRNNKRVKRLDISNGKTIATSSLWISTRHNQWKLENFSIDRQEARTRPETDSRKKRIL